MTLDATTTVQADGRVKTIVWSDLNSTDSSGTAAQDFALFSDRSVQMRGTFGTGTLSSVVLRGSNDGGTTWANLTDPQGNVISLSSAGLKQITEVCGLISPLAQGGDTTTLVDVYVIGKKVYP